MSAIKIVASDDSAAVLREDEIQDVLQRCRDAVMGWNWGVWVETYPDEAEDGSLNKFRVVMGPTVNTHPSFLFMRFYGGPAD